MVRIGWTAGPSVARGALEVAGVNTFNHFLTITFSASLRSRWMRYAIDLLEDHADLLQSNFYNETSKSEFHLAKALSGSPVTLTIEQLCGAHRGASNGPVRKHPAPELY